MENCEDCLHRDICKIKNEVEEYCSRITNIPYPSIEVMAILTVDCKCKCRLTSPIPREYDGTTKLPK
jgi:hypothetical protein